MYGLIFVTWEKYLNERFGALFLKAYRETIGEKIADYPLANRLYDDAVLLAGVGAASQLSSLPVTTLLHEYGRYFIINGLTSHLCMYILSDVHSGRDLLLSMRDSHARLRPPLFEYGRTSLPNEVTLYYDSPRQLCEVLIGAIEGAAERYGETVQVVEISCMKQGAPVCQLKASFSAPKNDLNRYSTPERDTRRAEQKELMKQIWIGLPEAGTIEGRTLQEIQAFLKRYKHANNNQLRPAVLLEALNQLQFAGYVTSTATQASDNFTNRRYWRVHRHM